MSALAALHGHTPSQNKINTFVLFAVAIPAIVANHWLSHNCHADIKRLNAYVKSDQSWEAYTKHAWTLPWSSTASFHDNICNMYIDHPIWMLNILFLINVDILFWIISLIQQSTWLIDPYWTIIPVMISHFFWSHPLAASSSSNPRAFLCIILVYVWAIRLTHSYFRREEWQMGVREDWRYADIKQKLGGVWPLTSFVIVYIPQHLFLVGISLPMYVILDLGTNTPFTVIDIILAAVCLLAVGMAYFADTQLFHYMNNKPSTPVPADEDDLWKSIIAGGNTNMLLNSGLWYYSRHPNYFSEQLWWWALSGYCVHILGRTGWWYLLGPFINSVCLAIVTVMVEMRINQRKERVHVYKMYRESTSPLIPLPKFTSKGQPSQRNKKEL